MTDNTNHKTAEPAAMLTISAAFYEQLAARAEGWVNRALILIDEGRFIEAARLLDQAGGLLEAVEPIKEVPTE